MDKLSETLSQSMMLKGTYSLKTKEKYFEFMENVDIISAGNGDLLGAA